MHRSATLDRGSSSRQSAANRAVREHVIRLLRTEIEFINNKSFRTIDRVFRAAEVLAQRFEAEVSRFFVTA